MKVRLEINKVNGKAFSTEIPDKYFDEIRMLLLSIRETERIFQKTKEVDGS